MVQLFWCCHDGVYLGCHNFLVSGICRSNVHMNPMLICNSTSFLGNRPLVQEDTQCVSQVSAPLTSELAFPENPPSTSKRPSAGLLKVSERGKQEHLICCPCLDSLSGSFDTPDYAVYVISSSQVFLPTSF